MKFDNLVEVLVYSNPTGRREMYILCQEMRWHLLHRERQQRNNLQEEK